MADGLLGAGSEIAGYRIQSVLGRGGMGVVYLAERPQGGLCALKVLSAGSALDVDSATRFKREARYASTLEHPNVLGLYDVGETAEGTPFFAMQYVAGEDLGALLAREGVMSLAQALTIVGQVGSALDAAHGVGIVHRDVKPANVIVAHDPEQTLHAYLTDFGLSKSPDEDSIALTRQGQFVGTMPYTAPEEILGQPRDHLVDVYSLACVLYEMLVGTPPFVRERDLDVLYAHIGDPRPSARDARPDLPPEIDAVIARAMAIAPADRYASCAELVAAARALLSDSERATPGASPVPPPHVGEQAEDLRLVVREGFGLGREVLVEGELVLGRLTTLDGALSADRGISRQHARVWRDDDGALLVEDAGSANGTFVNAARIDGSHLLRTGDTLQIGSCVFAVEPREPVDRSAAVATEPAPEPVVAPSEAEDMPAPGADAKGPVEPSAIPVETEAPAPSSRLAMRVELDLDLGEMVIAIEGGPAARIVREGDRWRLREL